MTNKTEIKLDINFMDKWIVTNSEDESFVFKGLTKVRDMIAYMIYEKDGEEYVRLDVYVWLDKNDKATHGQKSPLASHVKKGECIFEKISDSEE